VAIGVRFCHDRWLESTDRVEFVVRKRKESRVLQNRKSRQLEA
jgi:hypothetical protein